MANIEVYVGSDIPARIYAFHERKAGDWRRPHLGASIIGKECERALWYDFRWCTAPSFDGRMLRLFETGQLAENRLFLELINIGINVHSQQKRVQSYGHFGGSIDAIGEGFSESNLPHVVEVKTHNAKSWNELQKNGVERSKPMHYAQMQTYMGHLKIFRAYYFAINKDTDEIYAERVRFDADYFKAIMDKAQRIIYAETPPEGISTNPAYFICKFCDHRELCHGKAFPEKNCRTCIHSTPIRDGGFLCEKDEGYLDIDAQKIGCKDHLFIPQTMKRKPTKAGDTWVEYDDGFLNQCE